MKNTHHSGNKHSEHQLPLSVRIIFVAVIFSNALAAAFILNFLA